jgi:hypothetical protein
MLLVAVDLDDFGSASRLRQTPPPESPYCVCTALCQLQSRARDTLAHRPTLHTLNRDFPRLTHVYPARHTRNTQTISARNALVTARTRPPNPKTR